MELLALWAEQFELDPVIAPALHGASMRLANAARLMDQLNTAWAYGTPLPPTSGKLATWAEWLDLPGIAGFWGVGLWLPEGVRGNRLLPTVFVDPALASVEGEPVSRCKDSEVRQRMCALGFPGPLIVGDIWMVGREATEPQNCRPGQGVCVSEYATLGCRATLSTGERAITTAGHSARARDQIARVGGQRVGRVASTRSPRSCGPAAICPDVTLIRLDEMHREAIHSPFHSYAKAIGRDQIWANVSSGREMAWVRGLSDAYWEDKTTGAWGQVMHLDRLVSKDGDSGSPVELGPGAGQVTGHVVAGGPGVTLVQDLSYQLNYFGAHLRL